MLTKRTIRALICLFIAGLISSVILLGGMQLRLQLPDFEDVLTLLQVILCFITLVGLIITITNPE